MQDLGCKVFFIGFNKCGTRSLHKWLCDAGVRSFHGSEDAAGRHTGILLNVAVGRPALLGLDEYDAYLDVGAVQSQFLAIDRDYPGSKFVLNVRDIDRWIVSRLNHAAGGYVNFMNLYYGVNFSWSEWAARWRREFLDHHHLVMHHFKGRADFLRFDVETDKPPDLARFLGLQDAADELPRENVTPSRHFGLSGGRIVALAEIDEAVRNLDTVIAQREMATVQRDQAVAQRDAVIVERDALAVQRDRATADRDTAVAQCRQMAALAGEIASLAAMNGRLTAQHEELAARHADAVRAAEAATATHRRIAAEAEAMRRSRSWRMTAPLRKLSGGIARIVGSRRG